jgi:acetylornithine deacetylase
MDTLFAHLDDIITQQRDDQIAFVQQLVRTRSANPFTPDESDPAVPIERDVARLIFARLRAMGLDPAYRGVTDARPNVVATLAGSGTGDRSLILNGHMDTVMPSVQWRRDPFGGVIEDNRLYGVGALDMKASLGVLVYAVQALLAAGVELAGDLILAFVVDEEPGACSAFGSGYLLDHGLRATSAIIAEPMNDNVTTGHRGGYRFRLTVTGEAAHTGLLAWERGESGRNAILGMAAAIEALQGVELPFDETPVFPGRRPVFTFPTMIRGGVSINTVPDACTAFGDVRVLPGVEVTEIPPDHALVQTLVEHTAAVTGYRPSALGCGPWNDGWMFITRGIPAICGFGPNGAGVHAADEYVELDSLVETTRIFARAILTYLGVSST